MESSECTESAQGKNNAWLIDKLRDNVVSCSPPNYAKGFPPAIAYMVCDRVFAPRCSPQLDGTPNGFLLALGETCKSPRIKSACGGNMKFNHVESTTGGVKQYEIASWFIGVLKDHPDCRDQASTYWRQKYLYIDKLNNEEELPVCSDLNAVAREKLGADNRFDDTKFIIVREFYSDLCPEYTTLEGRNLNAFVVQKLIANDALFARDIFMCSSSLEKKNKVPIEFRPGTGGKTVRQTSAEAYDIGYFTMKSIFQDDRCGVGKEANAYTIRFERRPK
jgi:hypothetical protein